MLIHLSVRDFAIVESVEIDFGPGLTVVTGETGAGKSLIVDALLFLSGTRADNAVVRAGCTRAELSATFDLSMLPQVRGWLAESELDDDAGECILRRVIRIEGGSKAWVNGRPVPNQTLAELASRLIEIHGQHEHQALLDRGSQLTLLDAHGGHAVLAASVCDLAGRWRSLEQRRIALVRSTGEDGGRADLLRHHLQELEAHTLTPDAIESLEQDHRRLTHQGDILAACDSARTLLDGENDHAVLTGIARIRQYLEQASTQGAALVGVLASVTSAEVELREASNSLDAYFDGIELDPARLSQLEARLSRLHDLSRKHRVPLAALQAERDRIADELSSIEHADRDLEALASQQIRALADWRMAATELTNVRLATAQRLSLQVTSLMAELGMAGGRFDIELEPITTPEPDALGQERAEFMVSANPGQPLRALRKVASGGELSRIALAIEVAAIGNDPVPTMVFDEVDAGVGGAVAEILGRKLRQLGGHAQVMCVTHLAQVAAQGHAHIHVRKSFSTDQTRTEILPLSDEDRVSEIARMLGGVEITDATLAHARQLLSAATRQ